MELIPLAAGDSIQVQTAGVADLGAKGYQGSDEAGNQGTEGDDANGAVAEVGGKRQHHGVGEGKANRDNDILGGNGGRAEIGGCGFADHHDQHIVGGVVAANGAAAEEAYDVRTPGLVGTDVESQKGSNAEGCHGNDGRLSAQTVGNEAHDHLGAGAADGEEEEAAIIALSKCLEENL